jgi:group II intron reverse transcriptase/maturase
MMSAQELDSVSTKYQRIAELAKRDPGCSFTSLAHHIDLAWLKRAYQLTRKDGAVGIDEMTAKDYEQDLEANLERLLEAAKSGRYYAPPVKRVWLPKGDGSKLRPIGIPTFEDKVLQRAVARVLEAVYEQDFHDHSYGFRPGRSAHQALKTVWEELSVTQGGWVLELDIEAFFDTLEHGHLRAFIRQRVCDGVMGKLIDKWLKAGVMEDGQLSYKEDGTPQGGVVSPLLANVYLHAVLDTWFEDEVRPRMCGRCALIRYADDAVLMFSDEADARKVLEVLPKRFARYGLRLHPSKTRLVHFVPPPRQREDQEHSFDLLGFTHYWGRSQKGRWVIKRKTAKDRLQRALKRVKQWCQRHRHDPVKEQFTALSRKLKGHYGYYGIIGNRPALYRFRMEAIRIWVKWLGRRSQRRLSWADAIRLLIRWHLPEPPPWQAYVT